ncbi:uncharacterized protein AC631_05361, partial [Debaryomyces fabryi]
MNSSINYDDASQKSSTVDGLVDDNKIPVYQGFDQGVSSQVHNLARTMSRTSEEKPSSLARTLSNMSQVPGVNPMAKEDGEIDLRLDPDSENFDSKFWVKNLRKMYNSDPAYYKPSSLGVAYKDLRAYGIATDADYQADVGNVVYKSISQTIKGFID